MTTLQILSGIRDWVLSNLSGYYTKSQTYTKQEVNTLTQDFITASVNNLVNYYLKSETYTKQEVQQIIAAIRQFHFEIYASTSAVTEPASNVLYLIGPTGQGSDKYEEYVYPNSTQGWTKIGDTSIDLSGYYTSQQTDAAIAAALESYSTTSQMNTAIANALNTALTDYTTTANLTTLLEGKQDVISDLATIRSGAAAGATAYQKPSGGIPKGDLQSGVQASLSKADTAAQQSDTYTKQEVNTLTQDFITASVNNLVNYYLKSETYTKQEVQQIIAAIRQFHFEIYASTSAVTEPASNVLYLIGPTGQGSDKYEEYVYPNNTQGWTKIGDTSIDLSGYYTSQQTDAAIATALESYSTTSQMNTAIANALNTALADYSTTTQMNTAIATALASYYTKQEVDAEVAALQTSLEDGTVVPALAKNLDSWSEDDTPVTNEFNGIIRTTAGDDPIVTGKGGILMGIKATTDFVCSALVATAENQLRLKTNGGGAVAVGAGWYFPVPKLTLGQFGDATENNGLILVAEDGTNIQDATVYFKPFANGVPTSVTDGTVCPSQTVTFQEKTYKVYTTEEAGWLIVSGITYTETCARIAWEDWYDKFVSPTDADDGGGSVNLAPLFTAAPNGTGKFLVCGSAATYAERLGASQWQITDPVGRISSPEWTDTLQEDGETYLHELTISGMSANGDVLIEGSTQSLAVVGNVVSYADTSSTAISGAVRYTLASPATATVEMSSAYTLNDVGVEMKDGAEGEAVFTCSYMQNVADALSQIAKYKVGEIQSNLATLTKETKTTEADMQAQIEALQAIVGSLNKAEGYVRVAGSSSPALSYKHIAYDTTDGFNRQSAFSLFYPCLVGTKLSGNNAQVGKILYVLQKLGARTVNGVAQWLDINGVAHSIDGSEGDVMICNIEKYYRIIGKHIIEGTEYDIFLMSRTPFTWEGIEAEEVGKGGVSPDYVVSHADSDGVTRMHSVYNPSWNGSYTAPSGMTGKYVYSEDGEGNITDTFDGDATLLGGAGGLHSTNIALYTGEQRAMNHNPDTTKTVPFMNSTAASVENWFALMLAEGGTFDAHNASLMGSGYCANDAASANDWDESASGAKNGMRVVDKDGVWKYYGLSKNVRFLTGATSGTVYAGQRINDYRSPWHVMEAHRAVSYAVGHGVGELEWFVFEGSKYKYRSIEGFNGPSQGEMTCVVWKVLAAQAGASAYDPTDHTTSIAGNRVEFLVSTALFHGICTQVSPSWWTSGLIFTEDGDKNYEAYMERDQARLIKSENGEIATSENFNFENLYKHVGSFTLGEDYRKNYSNDALMLPDTNANKSGGGLHTYVGAYNWYTGGAASSGKKSVRGFRRGISANYTYLSPLSMSAGNAPSIASSNIGFGTCCRIVD